MAVIACASIAGGSVARAQVSQLDVVDASVEDVSPLAVSTRLDPIDFRSPTAFERVYRAADGGGFIRISGAIVAEYFRGEYVQTQWGEMPIVPAGTVYYIGAREGQLDVAPAAQSFSALRVSAFVTNRVDAGARAASGGETSSRAQPLTVEPSARPTVWTNEAYRQKRMVSAIERAMRRRDANG